MTLRAAAEVSSVAGREVGTLPLSRTKRLSERNDVTATIQFEYNNTKLQITFPAGTDYTPVLTDTDTMYGFYGVAAKLGLTITVL